MEPRRHIQRSCLFRDSLVRIALFNERRRFALAKDYAARSGVIPVLISSHRDNSSPIGVVRRTACIVQIRFAPTTWTLGAPPAGAEGLCLAGEAGRCDERGRSRNCG